MKKRSGKGKALTSQRKGKRQKERTSPGPAGKPVKSGSRRWKLIDHSRSGNTWLEFPEMKGRVVEKIEFYSSSDYNTLSVIFADQTSLNLEIVTTGFEIRADLERRSQRGNYGVIKRWSAIRSES